MEIKINGAIEFSTRGVATGIMEETMEDVFKVCYDDQKEGKESRDHLET